METSEVGVQNQKKIESVHCPTGDLLLAPYARTETAEDLKIIFGENSAAQLCQGANSTIITDLEGVPKYFIKERQTKPVDIQKYIKKGDTKYGFLTKESLYAGASIANEMRMAEKVNAVIEQSSAQEWAKNLGFQGISVIKPLGGFIERPGGKKYTVYPFINGEPWQVQSQDEFHDVKKPVS